MRKNPTPRGTSRLQKNKTENQKTIRLKLLLDPAPTQDPPGRPETREDCQPCPECQERRDSPVALPVTCGHHTFEEMVNRSRPCVRVWCSQNNYLEVNGNGSIVYNDDVGVDPTEVAAGTSCALESGGMTLESIGGVLKVRRERIRQIESSGLRKMKASGIEMPTSSGVLNSVKIPGGDW